MIRRSVLVTLWTVLSQLGLAVTYNTRKLYLTKTMGSECQTYQSGPPWSSSSPVACHASCTELYTDICNSIVYNNRTQTCYPGGSPFVPLETVNNSIPVSSDPDDAIYYPNTIPAPQCNTRLGFQLYDVCGTSACLYIPTTSVVYSNADDDCQARNGRLFVANSLPKFSLFWFVSLNVIRENTYIGLTDTVVEGDFVWANGEPLDGGLSQFIWVSGQPVDVGGEDCVEARHKNWPGVFGLNDARCTELKFFICEEVQ